VSQFDYTPLADAAASLIGSFGRDATATIPGGSQSVVPGSPHRGRDTGGNDTFTIRMVIVDFREQQIDGSIIRRTDKLGWVRPVAGKDMTRVASVSQSGFEFAVTNVIAVEPVAGESIAYRMTLRR